MKNKKTILSLFVINFFSLALLSAQNESVIKITKGQTDTVSVKQHVIVGLAPLNSEIKIDGKIVKQYKTGAFGDEIVLKDGDNLVKIEAISNGKSYEKSLKIFYRPVTPAQTSLLPLDFVGKVVETKDGAYLNFGSGDDRLGGTKINFLSQGIKLEVIDSVSNLYKVKLSDNFKVFIPKEYTNPMTQGTRPAKSLTGSWSVTTYEKGDKVRVSLDERVPYVVYYDKALNMLVAEIHGANCNSNWITQFPGLKSIEYVDIRQTSTEVVKVMMKLKNNYMWGYEVAYAGNALEISIKKRPSLNLKDLTIGIDAGHGGPKSFGAVGVSGLKEKDQNLAMAYMLKEELERYGAKVVLSRSDDSDMNMIERKRIFAEAKIDLLVSIHCNAGGNPLKTGGTSTYYKHIEYRDLAETILARLLELDVKNFGLVGNFNFSMNAPTQYPSVLVETLFMSNLAEEELLSDPAFQRKMMQSVVKGLRDYLKKVKKAEK